MIVIYRKSEYVISSQSETNIMLYIFTFCMVIILLYDIRNMEDMDSRLLTMSHKCDELSADIQHMKQFIEIEHPTKLLSSKLFHAYIMFL